MRRSLIYLLLAITFAIIILFVVRPGEKGEGDRSDELLIENYDAKDIQVIEIEQLMDGIKVRKNDDGTFEVTEFITPLKKELYTKEGRDFPKEEWFRADEFVVKRALGSFGGLTEGVLVSKSKDRHKLYRVGEMGLKFKAYDNNGKEVVDIVVGKNGPGYDSNFVRRSDEDDVYLVDNSLQGMFSVSRDDWRNKNIWQIPAGRVTGLKVIRGKKIIDIQKGKDGSWVSDNSKLNTSKVDALLSKLTKLKAEGFFAKVPGGSSEVIVELDLDGGKKEQLLVFSKKLGKIMKWFTHFPNDKEVYLIPASWGELIPKSLKKLK